MGHSTSLDTQTQTAPKRSKGKGTSHSVWLLKVILMCDFGSIQVQLRLESGIGIGGLMLHGSCSKVSFWRGGLAFCSIGGLSLDKILVTFSGGATRRIFSAELYLFTDGDWSKVTYKWVYGNLCVSGWMLQRDLKILVIFTPIFQPHRTCMHVIPQLRISGTWSYYIVPHHTM